MFPNKFLKGSIGVYGIRNLTNNKIYIGKTTCMYKRCHQHVYDLTHKLGKHVNERFMHAYCKSDLNNFEFFPIEYCESSELSDREYCWMIALKSLEPNFGYNIRSDVDGSMITSPDTSEKISLNLKKQWSTGVRDGHGDKLRKSWDESPNRKKEQSKLMTQIKTKYEYDVFFGDSVETCDYKRLVELGLKNVNSQFHRKKSNDIMYKNQRIIRYSKGER